ncbi:MAG: dTDP-4-dehydrorhamnose 3,5-epimerase family protein [Bacteroidales bacterium]|nr:dTDP-4-dehydrorhamnose 3,5-epimerase family protein [Bacteroidales bacterium]
MTFNEIHLRNAFLIKLSPFEDERGYFVRMYCKKEFKEIGFNKEFVQVNHSLNKFRHTFRGFHYQIPPFSETKLIRCMSGKVRDYIIDIRKNSPTFLQHFAIDLSADKAEMILVPEGFAHGYITLEDNSGLVYFHTEFYKPGFEGGLRHNDPELKINLPFNPKIISDRDTEFPLISESQFEGLVI